MQDSMLDKALLAASILTTAGLLSAPEVQAQSCTYPGNILPVSTTYSYLTAWAPNSLPILGGVFPSPQRDT